MSRATRHDFASKNQRPSLVRATLSPPTPDPASRVPTHIHTRAQRTCHQLTRPRPTPTWWKAAVAGSCCCCCCCCCKKKKKKRPTRVAGSCTFTIARLASITVIHHHCGYQQQPTALCSSAACTNQDGTNRTLGRPPIAFLALVFHAWGHVLHIHPKNQHARALLTRRLWMSLLCLCR